MELCRVDLVIWRFLKLFGSLLGVLDVYKGRTLLLELIHLYLPSFGNSIDLYRPSIVSGTS